MLQQAKEMLKNSEVKYVDLLDSLCDLEREYGHIKNAIILGAREDVESLWRIAQVADKIKLKIAKKLEEKQC